MGEREKERLGKREREREKMAREREGCNKDPVKE
jgi:hypothetical protein